MRSHSRLVRIPPSCLSTVAGATVLLSSSWAWAAPTVTLVDPKVTGVNDTFAVSATVTDPTFALSSVVADGDGIASKTLTAGANNAWSGTLDVSALPIGPFTLTIKATNANGEITTATKSMMHSHPPTVTSSLLRNSAVAPHTTISATCAPTDGYPCAKVELLASVGGGAATVLATANGATLSQAVNLSAYEGKEVSLQVRATDAAGLTALLFAETFVESSPNLVLVDTVPGSPQFRTEILDVDATRTLYSTVGGIVVRDRTTGIDTQVEATSDTLGFLFSGGVATPRGTLRATGWTPRTTRSTDFAVSGDYAAWFDGATIWRENLATEVIDQRGASDLPWAESIIRHPVVGIDGAGNLAYVRVYANTGTIITYRVPASTGVATQIGTTSERHFMPLVTGGSVMTSYVWSPALNGFRLDPIAAEGLAMPGIDYRVTNTGFIAYTKREAGKKTVRTRGGGTADALASPYTDATIAALNDQGEVAADAPSGRSISKAGGGPALPIGGASGKAFAVGNDWYIAKGRMLLKVAPGAGPPFPEPPGPGGDGGAPDAGGSDAGSDGGATDGGGSSSSSSSSGASGSSSGASGSSSSGSSSSASSSGASSTSTSSGGAAPSPDGGGGGAGDGDAAGGCAASSSREGGAGIASVVATIFAFAGITRRRRRMRG